MDEETFGSSVDSIVVLMLENRSFDMVFGNLYDSKTSPEKPTYYLGADQDHVFKGTTHWRSQAGPEVGKPPVGDPSQQLLLPVTSPYEPITHVQRQLYNNQIPEKDNDKWDWEADPDVGTMTHGFLKDYTARIAELEGEVPDWAKDPSAIWGAFNKAHLPNFYLLAHSCVISDEWFCSVPSQTWTNRLFQFAGRSKGVIENENSPAGTARHLYSVRNSFPTIHTVLGEDAQVVSHGNMPSLTRLLHGGRDVNGIDYATFEKQCDTNKLPRYTFIEPLFTSGVENLADSMHPFDMTSATGGNPVNLRVPITHGDDLIAKIFSWLYPGRNYGIENRRLFIVTFDEHGGCGDHIPPPPAANQGIQQAEFFYKLSSEKINFNFQRLGVRVPYMMYCPQLQAAGVLRKPLGAKSSLDHSSIIKSLALWSKLTSTQRSNLAGLSDRVVKAPSFWAAFQDGPPPNMKLAQSRCSSLLSQLSFKETTGPFPECPLTHLSRSIVVGHLAQQGVDVDELEYLYEAMKNDKISGEAARYILFRKVGFGQPIRAEKILEAAPAQPLSMAELIEEARAYSQEVHSQAEQLAARSSA